MGQMNAMLRKMMMDGNNQHSKYNLRKIQKEKRIKKYLPLINEAYGSFPGQYDNCKEIAEKLIEKVKNKEYKQFATTFLTTITDNSSIFGKVIYYLNFHFTGFDDNMDIRGERKYDSSGNTIITLYAEGLNVNNPDLSGTLGHEIMHCFQDKLKRVKGTNERSMTLYQYLMQFASAAPSVIVEEFFYGMYLCFFIEQAANISSISNYLEQYFKNKPYDKITTEDIVDAVKENKKYQQYAETLSILQNDLWTKKDKEYVFNCMTRMLENPYTKEYIRLFEPETFDVDTFINKNIQNICKICKETKDKMLKNTTIFFEKIHPDSRTTEDK